MEGRRVKVGLDEEKVVIFAVGGQEYAVSIQGVKEVVPWVKPTAVPEAPRLIEGIIDLRGDLIPILDLASRFGVTRAKQEPDGRVMVVEIGTSQVGIIVDEVTEVHTVDPAQLNAAGPMLTQAGPDPVVCGILKAGPGRLVIMIDLNRILPTGTLDSVEDWSVRLGG